MQVVFEAVRRKRRAELTAGEKEHARAVAIAWKRNNPDRNRATKRAWEARNSDKVSKYSRKQGAKWRAANRRLGIERSLLHGQRNRNTTKPTIEVGHKRIRPSAAPSTRPIWRPETTRSLVGRKHPGNRVLFNLT